MKKIMYTFLCLSLASCQQSIQPLKTVDTNSLVKSSNLNLNTFSIKSTDANSGIKKSFLSISSNNFKTSGLSGTNKNVLDNQSLKIERKDLKRKFIINISSISGKFNPKDLAININNKKVGDNQVNEDVSDISLTIDNFVEGDNNLDLSKITNKNLKIDIVGFVDPIDIPRAVHSKLLINTDNRINNYIKGKVGIKFREGMKVRLNKLNGENILKDETNISLTVLERFMKKYKVKSISNAIGKDINALDKDEIKAEELLGTDVPNQNLFYYLEVDNNTDIWKLVDELKTLPFIEEAFPDFIPKPAYIPNDPLLANGNSTCGSTPGISENSKWLRMAHIMPNTSLENGPDDTGAWDFTTGNKNINVYVIDYGAQINSPDTPYISSTHPDLVGVNQISDINVPSGSTTTDLVHGTYSVGTVGATGNNSTGAAGVAYGANITEVQAFQNGYPSKCLGQGGGTSNCDAAADSITLARNRGAKVIILEIEGANGTIEQDSPTVRASVTAAVANGVSVLVPSGNDHPPNTNPDVDIRNFPNTSVPTVDTGSIIVGALNLDGMTKMTHFNYGKSIKGGLDNLYTLGGHGVDVSSSGQNICSTAMNNNYGYFGASSGSTPAVGGIVALMLSVKPDLNPLEIRKALRETADTYNTDNNIMPGMVNAYQAVNRYYPGFNPVTPTGSGLEAKFYSNTIFPAEVTLDNLSNSTSSQNQNVPYYRKPISNIDFNTNLPDAFGSGLNYDYIADIKGLINFTQTGTYQFALYHDDGSILKIDGQTIISTQRNNTDGYSYGSVNITSTTNKHDIQLIRSQSIGNANTVLWWQPPGGSYSVIPASAFTRTTLNTNYSNTLRNGLIGRFFENTNIPIDPTNSNNVYIGNKVYANLNSTLNGGDAFLIGRSDNFAGFFSGFIKIPSGYTNGNYKLKVYHDDGAILYFNNRQIFSNLSTSTDSDPSTVSLSSGIAYPFALHYKEITGNTELRFAWVKPNGVEEIIPVTAFFY